MMRIPTDSPILESVWLKAEEIPGLAETVWRRDPFGAAIRRADYLRTDSEFGWVIIPVAAPPAGQPSNPGNLLKPCQWRNARTLRAG